MRMFHILKSIHLLLFCCYLSACGSGNDNDNSSNQSNPDSEAPTAVSNVIDTTTYQTVTLTWNAASDNVGIDHYQIMRDGDAIGTTQATSFTDRTVNENSDYTYSVVAYDAAGNSSTSASIRVSVPANSNGGTDTEAPSAVTNLDVSSTYQAVTLSWSAATDNVGIDHYQITRNGDAVGTTETTAFTDNAVSEETDYTYHVIAIDAAGNRTSSDALPVSVPANPNPGVLKAFPSAEGFGANATGGRNGQVIKVTNLSLSGSGSLQAALDINAPRIIVFEVSGVIEGDILIPYGDVTIAGQTAPGAGITIHGRLTCQYSNPPDNIIVRHIRVRADHSTNPGVAGNQYDGIQCSRSSNLIFDHISVSGGVDETFDIYEATDVTVQWSTISRADTDGHQEGVHNYGLLNGPNGSNISIHHNLFAHNGNRNPAVANGPAEIINNLVYNVRHGFVHHNPATGDFNIIGNYYKQGPENSLIPFFFDDEYSGSGTPQLSYFLQDNYVDDPGDLVGSVDNPWLTPYAHSSFENIDWGWNSSVARAEQKHAFAQPVTTVNNALTNYGLVLNSAGAFPRDQIDSDNVEEVNAGTGSWGARIPSDLMQGLSVTTPPTDSDNDGMPDDWENSHGLSNTTDDHNSVMSSGYTAIEAYINELADQSLTNGAVATNDLTTLDVNVSPVTSGNWYRPGVETTWAWQLQGTLNTGYPVNLYDIDLFDTSAADIASLQANGKRVLCYFSAGSFEDWRDDAADFQTADLGNTLSGYADERWLDIRSTAVFSVMLARLDLALSKGCDGVEPDNMNSYQQNSGFALTASDQLAFNRNLFNAAHERGLTVALKNDLDQVGELIDYVDLMVNEQCHEYNECHLLQPFITAGKPVLNAEYLTSYQNNPNSVCIDAQQTNIRTLVLSVDLDDSFYYNCDTDYP
ncbi:MAG: endo alpha-1,4 polygalactosaminidase [Candidatus Thiodiazotropha sp.]